MPTDTERREVAARLRGIKDTREGRGHEMCCDLWSAIFDSGYRCTDLCDECEVAVLDSLADLIEPSYKPNAEYEMWYNNLSHFGDEQGGPSTIRELIEEIVWAALTVDLGPNGNTDPSTGIDGGDVYTNNLFAEWEREALRLSGGCDRDALLELADEMDERAPYGWYSGERDSLREYARRIREALGEVE